jgi:hypothetical protein
MGHVFSTWLDATETLGDITLRASPSASFHHCASGSFRQWFTYAALHLGLTRR